MQLASITILENDFYRANSSEDSFWGKIIHIIGIMGILWICVFDSFLYIKLKKN